MMTRRGFLDALRRAALAGAASRIPLVSRLSQKICEKFFWLRIRDANGKYRYLPVWQ